MLGLCITVLLSAFVPLQIKNGDFRLQADGRATGWEPVTHYRALPDSGRNSTAALEMSCSGLGDSSGAQQVIRLNPARRGPFVVSAWVKCEGVEDGGDCALWLDVFQEGGNPLYGRQGIPDRNIRGWQHVKAEVRPDKPVNEIQIWLLLRNVKGAAKFCDIQVKDIPIKIKSLRLMSKVKGSYDVRAEISEYANWTLNAYEKGKVVWTSSGEGKYVSKSFEGPFQGKISMTLTAGNDGRTVNAKASAESIKNDKPLDWWVVDSYMRIFQDDLPPSHSSKHVALDAARNDRESFQICLRAHETPTANISVAVSDLVMDKPHMQDKKIIAGDMISWYRVGYVWVKQPQSHPECPRDSSSWWPDPLLPGVRFSVEPWTVQPLWFTVHIPKDAVPGCYTGKIDIAVNGTSIAVVPLTINVRTAIIPDRGHMKTAFALMDGYLKKVYGQITPGLRRAYTDYLLAHHLNPDDISRTNPPDLDELEYANKRGLNAFNILNVVPEPDAPVIWTCFSPLEEYTPEFKKRFLERLDQIVPELEKRGLIDKAYIYGFDERGPEYIPVIRDIFGEIKKRYPKIHTLSTCWPPQGTDPLSMNIDWFVPLSSAYDHKLAETVRKRGGEMWWYICLGPNYPYANWLLENPLMEARIIWWQAYKYGVEGFLYWGLNIWEREHNDKPIDDSTGPRIDWSVTTGGDWANLNGDGVLLYPSTNGPIGSIRMEAIRDGLEDIELLRLLEHRSGAAAVEKLLADVVTDRIRYSRDPEKLKRVRKRLLDGLGEMVDG